MSKNRLPYYKRYPRDLIEGTVNMPFEEKCAYAFLLDLIYVHEGNLPDDPRWIAGQLNVSVRKWKSLRSALIERGKIQVSGEFLTNYRAIIELESLGKFQDKQSRNRSGSSKNKDLEKPRSDHPEPEPEPDKKVSLSSSRSSGNPRASAGDGRSVLLLLSAGRSPTRQGSTGRRTAPSGGSILSS